STEAESALHDGLIVQKQLAADFPSVSDYQNEVAATLLNLAAVHAVRREYGAAFERLEEAQPYHLAALKAKPGHPAYRAHFRGNLLMRGRMSAQRANHEAATRFARSLRDLGDKPVTDAYDAACILAVAIAGLQQDPQLAPDARREIVERLSEQAVSM